MKLAEQQKNQRAEKNRTKILKISHDSQLAQLFMPTTGNLIEVKDFANKNLKKVLKRQILKTKHLN